MPAVLAEAAPSPIVGLYRDRLAARVRRPLAAVAAAVHQAVAPVSFKKRFDKAHAVAAERHRTYQAIGRRLVAPADMLCSEAFDSGVNQLAAGHAIVDAMRRDASGFAVEPHAFQVTLIEFGIELMGPSIYGTDVWRQNHVAIRQRNGWTTPNNGVGAVQSGRKDGKSTGIAMLVVLALLNIPHFKVSLFAKVHKQSRIILGLVSLLARGHIRCKDFKVQPPNVNKFALEASSGDVRQVLAHSGDAEVRPRVFLR